MDKKETILATAANLYAATHVKGSTPQTVEKRFLEWVSLVEKAYETIKD